MPLIATLVDNFTSGTLDTSKWTASGTTAIASGKLTVTHAPAVSPYTNRVFSQAIYTLAGSSFIAEVDLGSNTGSADCYTTIRLISGSNYIHVFWRNRPTDPRLFFQVFAGAVEDATSLTGATQVNPLDAALITATRWLRVREASGVLTFETSPDGTTWTSRRTMNTPSWVTSATNMQVQLAGVKDAGAATVSQFDNINLPPGVIPPPPVGGSTFADALAKHVADGSLKSYWPLNDVYTTTDVVAGRNASNAGGVTFSAAGAQFNGLTNGYLSVPDNSAFSAVTTGQLTILAAIKIDDWHGGADSPHGERVHFLSKGTGGGSDGHQEWSFRMYRRDGTGEATTRIGWLSYYHFSSTGPSGGQGEGARVRHTPEQTAEPFPTRELFIGGGQTGGYGLGGYIETYYDRRPNTLSSPYHVSWGSTYHIVPEDTDAPVVIGARLNPSEGYHKGQIRRLMVFNRILTEKERFDIYDAMGRPEGTWGGEGAPSTTFFAGLHDTFTTGFDAAWVFNNAGTIVGGTAHLASDTTPGNGIRSGYVYTLKDSHVQMQLGPIVDTTGGTAAGTYSRAIIHTVADSTTKLEITVNPVAGTINFGRYVANVLQAPTSGSPSITYSPTQHAWVRFKESGGFVTFWTSPDGSTWTEQRRDPTPSWVSGASDQRLYLDVVKTAGAASYAVVDNVNSQPFSALVDDFASQDTNKWTWVGGSSVTGGAAVLSCVGTGNYPNGFNSSLPYMLADGDPGFTCRVSGLPSGLGRLSIDLAAGLPSASGTPYSTKAAGWFIDQTGSTAPQIEANYVVGGVSNGVLVTRQDWLNIRRNGANLEWRTSADGATWTVARSVAVSTLPGLEGLYAIFRSRNNGTVTGNYSLDDVGAVPKAPAAPSSLLASPGVGEVDLTWVAPVPNEYPIDSYRLSWTGLATPVVLGPTVLAYHAGGLTPGASYSFVLEAHNTWGYGTPATTSATPTFPVPDGPPSEPTNVLVTAGAASVLVSWTAPTTPNGTITGSRVVDQYGVTKGSVTGAGTSTTVTGLLDGLTYIFRVIATNADGDSLPSQPSAPFTPNPAGTTTGPLVKRAAFGAYPAGAYTDTEAVTGRALQPVAWIYRLGDPFPAAAIDTLGLRDRYALLLLDTSGIKTLDILDGKYDAVLDKFVDAITTAGRYVYVCPFFAGNDFVQPWSPQYTATVPWYDSAVSGETGSVQNLKSAFTYVARKLRGSQYARTVWAYSVDPQPDPAAESMAPYYPGNSADVCMLVGHNYGVGPEQGKPGLTEWLTPAAIFNTPYATAVGMLPPTTPVWLWTGCHEPTAPYVPNGPGFPPDVLVAADLVNDKAAWVNLLLGATTWPRVQAVVWNDTAGERDWRINSSAASAAAFYGKLGDPDDWVRTEIVQDRLGDHTRKLVSNIAKWARSGAHPATRTNEYQRPDARDGVRVSLTHVTPYSSGQKRTVNISAADMGKWNRLHGLLLRQAGRYGAQGWAYGSGAIPANEPSLMIPGTATASGVTLSPSADATPGVTMQVEGGMKNAVGS